MRRRDANKDLMITMNTLNAESSEVEELAKIN